MSLHKQSSSDLIKDPTMALVEELHSLRAHIHPPVPNPAPLGLFGFGMTTALLQMKTTRIAGDTAAEMKGVNTVLLGFALFFGGLLQIIAGVSEVQRNNVFGYTAFTLYGGFWMSIATIDIVGLVATGGPPPVNAEAMQAVLFMLGLISTMFWTLTFKLNKTICVTFFFLVITCALLCAGVKDETIDKAGGFFGFITAACAFWLGYAELVNDIIGGGKEIIPLGHWHSNQFKESGGAHVPGRIHGARPSVETNNAQNTVAVKEASHHQDTKDSSLEDVESNRRFDDSTVMLMPEVFEEEC